MRYRQSCRIIRLGDTTLFSFCELVVFSTFCCCLLGPPSFTLHSLRYSHLSPFFPFFVLFSTVTCLQLRAGRLLRPLPFVSPVLLLSNLLEFFSFVEYDVFFLLLLFLCLSFSSLVRVQQHCESAYLLMK
jgi:hypothetical protein